MFRHACCAALGVLLIASCGKAPETPDTEVAQGGGVPVGESKLAAAPEAVADVPQHLEVTKDYFVGSASIDDSLFEIAPDIAAMLVEDARARLEDMDADALAYKEADPDYFIPYSLSIQWTLEAAAGDLISLEGFTAAYSGGAHGNYGTDARIYNLQNGKQLSLSDLLTDPSGAMAESLPFVLSDIAQQRSEKVGGGASAETFRAETADALSADSILRGELGLVASTEAGTFGGFIVHFAPYEIGSYAEGAYKSVVPQSVFRDFLKPEYAALFAGGPTAED
tara:strand:- start:4460 stop:5302 length:843 start_codon:yes stop_codon:yes gene_type:complete